MLFRSPAVRHADRRTGVRRPGRGGRDDGHPACDRLHVRRLHPRLGGRDCEPDRQDAVHEQRPAEDADPAAGLHWHRAQRGDAPLGELLPDVREHSGPAGGGTIDPLRRQGALQARPALR